MRLAIQSRLLFKASVALEIHDAIYQLVSYLGLNELMQISSRGYDHEEAAFHQRLNYIVEFSIEEILSFDQQLVDKFTFSEELFGANPEVFCVSQGIEQLRCAIDQLSDELEESEKPLV